MEERRLESSVGSGWNKIIRDNLPSPLSVTEGPIYYWNFLQAVASSNSATQILGSQYEVINKFSFPPLHVFCVSACIKAVEKKKQTGPSPAAGFDHSIQTSSPKFSAKSQNLPTQIEGKTRKKLKSFFHFNVYIYYLKTSILTYMADLQQHLILICTPDLFTVKFRILNQQHQQSMTCCAFRSLNSWTSGLQQEGLRFLGSPVLFKGHLDESLILLGTKRAKKVSRKEKWAERNTKTSQSNPPERLNLLEIVKYE